MDAYIGEPWPVSVCFNSVKVHIAIAESAALQTSSMEKEVASSKLYKQASEKELSEIKSLCIESAEKAGLMEDLYCVHLKRQEFQSGNR